MRVYRRRRVFTIIIFLGVIGLIFLGFQVLSVQILSLETGKGLAGLHDNYIKAKYAATSTDTPKAPNPSLKHRLAKRKSLLHKKFVDLSKGPPTGNDQGVQHEAIIEVIVDQREGDSMRTRSPREMRVEHEQRLLEQEAWQVRRDGLVRRRRQRAVNASAGQPRGASPQQLRHYEVDAKGNFQCIDSGERILFSRLNDDYCDCRDGTDEPGTSACRNGQFYCQFQLDPQHLFWIPASKVNDAICDCCDASDEWDAPQLPPHVALHDGKPAYGVYQWPCLDYCHTLVDAHMTHLDVNQKGAIIRRQYIAEASGKDNPHHIYGKQGEFLPLRKSCFISTVGKYAYEVCPFQEVRQRYQGTARIIGRNNTVWVKQDAKVGFRLKMMGGDGMQCPMFKSRLTWVDFICGLDNKVLSVQETEVCEYTVKFETPAACSDVSGGGV